MRSTRWWKHPARDTAWQWHDWPSLAPRTRTPLPARVGLLGEEGRGFYQDLPLFAQRLDLATETAHFLRFLGCQSIVSQAIIDVSLLHPLTERLGRDLQLAGDLGHGFAAGPDEADGLGTERGRIGGVTLGHVNILPGFLDPQASGCPPNRVKSTEQPAVVQTRWDVARHLQFMHEEGSLHG